MSDIPLRRILTGADLMTHDLKIHATEGEARKGGGRARWDREREGGRSGMKKGKQRTTNKIEKNCC